jgi:hypothetical protein
VIKKGKVFRQKKSTTGAYLISYFTHEEGMKDVNLCSYTRHCTPHKRNI